MSDNKISTPRGQIVIQTSKGGKATARLIWNRSFGDQMSNAFSAAQRYVDSEVLRLSDPYVPMRTGMLKLSGKLGTNIGSGEVLYIAPYSKPQYYKNAGVGSQGTARGGKRGKLWFERMKIDHLYGIRAGAAKMTKR